MGNFFTRQVDDKEFSPPLPIDFAIQESLIVADKHGRRFIIPLERRYLNIAPEPSAIARYEKLSFRELIQAAEDNQSIELLIQLHRCLAEFFFNRRWHTYDGIHESNSKQIARVKLLLDYDRKWNVERKRCVESPKAARALLQAGLGEFVNRPPEYGGRAY
ncbi:hypothetical protein BJ875DRAFT_475700 [Amylocarpus encephaloides]|uniref:Uncharacterized protein n=1 Tax=Amylocarpus encephaloides TaxID=45428 RepID=A0A9P7Y9I8_9HELO|nr:hypothetical protein BJ875DRAFT_475700 [Amylocarpus encephaloides]